MSGRKKSSLATTKDAEKPKVGLVTPEQLKEMENRLAPLCPLDDLLFGFLVESPDVCEEMLRTILQDDKLTVSGRPHTQKEIRNPNNHSRTIRLDLLCRLGDGSLCNVEMQKERKRINHQKRARFHAASLTVSNTIAGDKTFNHVPDVIIVYISAFDVFRKGKTIYRCRRFCEDTGEFLSDGEKIIFVNTQIDDSTEIAYLMQLLTKKEIDDAKYPALTKQMNYLKHVEGGMVKVCKVMEDYRRQGVNEAILNSQMQDMRRFCRNGASMEEAIEYFYDLPRERVEQLYIAVHQHK